MDSQSMQSLALWERQRCAKTEESREALDGFLPFEG
jgi:hypothetical protein